MVEFAFWCAYTPGPGGKVDPFLADVAEPVLGSRDHDLRAALRRIYFEAFTLAEADLRRQVDRTESDAPLRMLTSERERSRAHLVVRLAAIGFGE
jgi:hypothetical protein